MFIFSDNACEVMHYVPLFGSFTVKILFDLCISMILYYISKCFYYFREKFVISYGFTTPPNVFIFCFYDIEFFESIFRIFLCTKKTLKNILFSNNFILLL